MPLGGANEEDIAPIKAEGAMLFVLSRDQFPS